MPNSWEEILLTRTPKCWIDRAIDSLDLLLLDHAHCEKKAATTAISLIHRYPEKGLSKYLSPLAREELLHFEQVTRMLKKNGFTYCKEPLENNIMFLSKLNVRWLGRSAPHNNYNDVQYHSILARIYQLY